jgi:hypothetical protein
MERIHMTKVVQDARGNTFPAYNPTGTHDLDLRKNVVVVEPCPPQGTHLVELCIDGRSANSYTNDELYEIIKHMESRVRDLDGVTNKPNALVRTIEQINANIQQVITWMDKERWS